MWVRSHRKSRRPAAPSPVEISRENRSHEGVGLSLALRMRGVETVTDDERGSLTWRRFAN